MINVLVMQNFKGYYYICLGIESVLYLILAWFYIYFGVKLSNFYGKDVNVRKEAESKERSFIHNKILFIAVMQGILFLIRGIFSFLICVNVFEDIYPSFININIWDSLVRLLLKLRYSFSLNY
jgi:small-conductance mechanosensitive channel